MPHDARTRQRASARLLATTRSPVDLAMPCGITLAAARFGGNYAVGACPANPLDNARMVVHEIV